ncbi:hypothetical protein NECAME_02457 [Necator americanus]|uniref:Uncharacterized protein n=1 Tax=Necator americanus TaxID=51031 RepID=W2TD57_NECAM|nr:hypothetical protein NECAME_02457 [Necator americanus]ETN79980.1 hypothetical protein NECAME_02457 [Necator americanus]
MVLYSEGGNEIGGKPVAPAPHLPQLCSCYEGRESPPQNEILVTIMNYTVLRQPRKCPRQESGSEWRGLQDIALHNSELIEELKAIRRRKAYDLMKYEHILQLPARKVNEYLAKESENPSKMMKSESEGIQERMENERRHKAAKVIQRAHTHQNYRNVLRPNRRVQLIAQINDRLNGRESLRNDHINIIKEKIMEYRMARDRDADTYAKRQLVIQSMKRDIAVLNSITPETAATPALLKCLGSTRPLANYKASLSHETEMERIDDRLIGIHF